MIINFLKDSWLVMLASLVFGLLVAGVHGQLKDRIAQNAQDKLNDKLHVLLSDADSFDSQTATTDTGEEIKFSVGKDNTGKVLGYAFKTSGGGFADNIELLIAFNPDITSVKGMAVLKSNETPGFGDKIKEDEFKNQFGGCPAQDKLVVVLTGDRSKADREIVAITGATISSDAVTQIVNRAILKMRAVVKK